MTTEDFISELFYRVDDAMKAVPKHPPASLWPSEGVTLGVLFARKGGSTRACDRWARHNLRPLCPGLPDRTRLLRRFATQHAGTDRFLAAPAVLGVVES